MIGAHLMRRCESYFPTGPSIALSKSLPTQQGADAPGREAAWALGQALALMEPLAVDLRIGLRFADEPILDEGTMPAHGTWHVRREDLNDERRVRPAVEGPGHQERRVKVIDPASIERVIAEAIGQPAPPDRLVTLFSLEAVNARARLLDPKLTGAESIPVWSGRHEHAVAVVRDERGSWIDVIADALERPLRLLVDNNDGAVGVNLYIAWSLWKQEGSAEHGAVLDFARAILAGGYEIEHVDPVFRAGLGA
jgi:hypothetical protein